jgi:hypothetical protein
MFNIYIPMMSVAKTQVQGTINTLLTGLILVCVLLIITEATRRWFKKDGKPVESHK